jgi:hypothetical protein
MIDHLYRYGDLTRWPPEMLEPLERIRRGETPPETAGEAHKPGGGLGWWTPIGIVNLGKPKKAAGEMIRLSAVWKRPAEQDLLAAVQAGVAHALMPRATVETVVEAAKEHVGSLTRSLIDRAVAVGRSVKRGEDEAFVDRCYENLLVNVAPDGVDDAVPPSAQAGSDHSKPCGSPLLAETVPLAFAALVFGDGRSRATMLAAAALGRDAKAIGSTVGAWIGALVGRARLPREWMGWVIAANLDDVDLVTQANALADEVEPKLEL